MAEVIKRTRRKPSNKHWSVQEEEAIARYLTDTPYLGKDQAKESQAKYERRMLEELELDNCERKQLSNKITAMKRKYEEAKKWIEESEQEFREKNPQLLVEEVRKICHYYYILDSWFAHNQLFTMSGGHRVDVIPNVISSTNHKFDEKCDTKRPADFAHSIQSSDTNVEDEQYDLVSLSDSPTTVDEETVMSVKVEPFSNYNLQVENDNGGGGRRGARKLVAVLNGRSGERADLEAEKLEFEKFKWLQVEQRRKEDRVEERKFELEKMTKQNELELKKIEIQNEAELRRMEIQREVEMKKIELERDKLKLEILKLQVRNPNVKLSLQNGEA